MCAYSGVIHNGYNPYTVSVLRDYEKIGAIPSYKVEFFDDSLYKTLFDNYAKVVHGLKIHPLHRDVDAFVSYMKGCRFDVQGAMLELFEMAKEVYRDLSFHHSRPSSLQDVAGKTVARGQEKVEKLPLPRPLMDVVERNVRPDVSVPHLVFVALVKSHLNERKEKTCVNIEPKYEFDHLVRNHLEVRRTQAIVFPRPRNLTYLCESPSSRLGWSDRLPALDI